MNFFYEGFKKKIVFFNCLPDLVKMFKRILVSDIPFCPCSDEFRGFDIVVDFFFFFFFFFWIFFFKLLPRNTSSRLCLM